MHLHIPFTCQRRGFSRQQNQQNLWHSLLSCPSLTVIVSLYPHFMSPRLPLRLQSPLPAMLPVSSPPSKVQTLSQSLPAGASWSDTAAKWPRSESRKIGQRWESGQQNWGQTPWQSPSPPPGLQLMEILQLHLFQASIPLSPLVEYSHRFKSYWERGGTRLCKYRVVSSFVDQVDVWNALNVQIINKPCWANSIFSSWNHLCKHTIDISPCLFLQGYTHLGRCMRVAPFMVQIKSSEGHCGLSHKCLCCPGRRLRTSIKQHFLKYRPAILK